MANLDNLLEMSVAKLEANVVSEIEQYKRSIKTTRSAAKKRIKLELPKRIEAIKTLVALGCMTSDDDSVLRYATCKYTWDEYNRVDVSGKIGVLRTMFGSDFVELNNDSKEEHDAAKSEVRVYLKHNSNWKGPKLYVVIKLDDTSKCKFKTITPEPYVTLVCSND